MNSKIKLSSLALFAALAWVFGFSGPALAAPPAPAAPDMQKLFPNHAPAVGQAAALAEVVYYPNGDPDWNNVTTVAGFNRLTTAADPKSGFKAAAYQDVIFKNIVVAYAGTDDVHDVLADLGIAEVDIGTAETSAEKAALGEFGKLAFLDPALKKYENYQARQGSTSLKPNADLVAQLAEADKFYDQIAAKHPGLNITITGHSLGGYLGQLVASRTGAYAILFNAPGAVDQSRKKSTNMITYVRKYDVVGNLGSHIGSLAMYKEVTPNLNPETRYVVRNHSIVQIRKDLSNGMAPLK